MVVPQLPLFQTSGARRYFEIKIHVIVLRSSDEFESRGSVTV